MFKREIRIDVVKKKNQSQPCCHHTHIEPAPWSPGNVAEATAECTQRLVKTVVGAAAGLFVLKTACEIAINYAPKN